VERTRLPVYQKRDRILQAVAENQVVVIESPTGSGKTTQIPLILLEAGYDKAGMIGVTQPRRIAAVSVSEFIARQTGTTVPGLVGYKMRFEDRTTAETRIKIMTDGILLQEIKHDPDLSAYGIIMVDEAHERSLNIDFILGLLKQIAERRSDLKILVSSATINSAVFSEYFEECPIVHIESEMFPVELVYDPPLVKDNPEELVRKIASIVDKRMKAGETGDFLIFHSGEKGIKDTITALQDLPCAKRLHILPLYGRLGKEEQEKVFFDTPSGKNKVVVATNIAETSVTIDGITVVIDTGLAKINFYSPRTFTESLIEVPVSKASANQRKGRAGRTRPGICYRLDESADFEGRPLFTTEEILRTDLSEVVLRMAELGITDFESFNFISRPGREGLKSAVKTLHILEALGQDNTLTGIGEMMVEFPLLPRLSRMIVEAIRRYPSVLHETIVAASFLSTSSPFLLPPEEEIEARRAHQSFSDPAGDFISYLKILSAFRSASNRERFCKRSYLDQRTLEEISNITDQLEEIVSSLGIPIGKGGSQEDFLCAVAGGLLQYVCVRQSLGVYRSVTAQRISIHPGSVMFRENPLYIVAGEIVKTTRMYARTVSPLRKNWLSRISPWLQENLIAGAQERDESGRERKRDTTWTMTFCGFRLQMRPFKGKKKLLLLPWEDLKGIAKQFGQKERKRYKDLRGVVVYGGIEILTQMKLNRAITIARKLSFGAPVVVLSKGILAERFTFQRDHAFLMENLSNLLKLCGENTSGTNPGFLFLDYSPHGNDFRYGLSLNLFSALSKTIAALETMGGFLAEAGDIEGEKRVGKLYRKLTEILEI